MQENENVNPEELQNVNLTTLPTETEEVEEKIIDGVEETLEEKEELSEEELKAIYIQQLKDSKKVFKPLSHPTKVVGTETVINPVTNRKRVIKETVVQTNLTTNKFDTAYKQKRKRKNKLSKTSRRNNR